MNKTGSVLASSSLDAMIKIWDVETGKPMNTIDASPGKLSSKLALLQTL